jgi:DNA-binding NarL/FixJ family response regulator
LNVVRVAIVDDQELVRTGFRMILESRPDMIVVGEAGDGLEAVELLRHTDADVVIMDVRMPRLDGVEATRRIVTEATASPRVLILTTFDLDEYVYAGLHAGASGFLLKDTPSQEMLRAVRTVAAGDAVVGPTVTSRLIDHFLSRPAVTDLDGQRTAALAPLTPRERDVFRELARGLSNVEIGEQLHLSEATVKSHVAHIFTKLQVRDRVQAVIYAHHHGLLDDLPGR